MKQIVTQGPPLAHKAFKIKCLALPQIASAYQDDCMRLYEDGATF